MSADLAARLRALTQDYHEGRLNLAAYRALRAPLLDSLVAAVPSASDMEITRPRAARPAVVASSEEPSTSPQPSPRKPFGPIVIALAVAAVAGGALLWFFNGNTGADADAGAMSGSPAISTDGALTSPVHGMVVAFTERGDWSDAHLAALNASLLEAGEHELAKVAREDSFQRFVDELRRHLKERQALATTPLTPDNSAIAALAVVVGLDLNSPDAAIHIASVEVPTAPVEAHSSSTAGTAGHDRDVIATGARTQSSAAVSSRGANDSASMQGAPKAQASEVEQRASAPTNAALASGPGSRDGAGGVLSARSSLGSGATESSKSAPVMGSVPSNAGSAPATADSTTRDGACRPELIRSRRPLCSDPLPAGEGPLLALVPAGSFDMGSTASSEEQPLHRVAIAAPFAISVNEVSQGEFRQFCAQTGRSCTGQPWTGDDYPVVNVTWSEARAYADWLSNVTHQRYRLPSEAQWEYAARAGQAGPFPGGDTLSPTDAHFSTSTKQDAPARRGEKFKANGFRLLHTLGNVREWVEDAWVPSYAGAPADGSAVKSGSGAAAESRVTRGGSYADGSARLRLSLREGLPENTRDSFTGFRVVRELP